MNVKVHPIPVVKKPVIYINKSISRPRIPTKPIKSVRANPKNNIRESKIELPISPPAPPAAPAPPAVQVRRPNIIKHKAARKSGSVATQHNNMLQQYKDSINKLRCIGNNRILVIIACGPSILSIDVNKLSNIDNVDIMCINKPDSRIWPSKYWLFCDQSQYSRNKELWDTYHGTIINASSVRIRHKQQVLIKSLSGRGFSRDIGKGFYIGRSSTYAAMQVALWMNYHTVYILGVDMCAVNGKLHYYGQNPDVTNESRVQRFDREAENYMYAGNSVLKSDERNRFIFCSSYNKYKFVDHFQRLHEKDVVSTILDQSNKL